MSSSGDDDKIIREYLLGRLSEEEREQFAQRFFTDEDLFERLEAAEEDVIDDYLIGNLSEDDVDMFHRNFLIGSEREQALRIGKAWRNYAAAHADDKPPDPEPEPRPWWQWILPGASGVTALSSSAAKIGIVTALLVFTTVIVWMLGRPSEVDKGLLALNNAYKQERPLQSRLTALEYAPYSPITRGASSGSINHNQLALAELTLRQVVSDKSTPEAHHALGEVLLAQKNFDEAMTEFVEALKEKPNEAQIYSDLGAAQFEKGKLEIERAKTDTESAESGKGAEYFARSLGNLNKALQLDQNLLEALYNRALLHESMGLLPAAEDDWRKYIEKDPSSKWADEARQKLTAIEQQRKTTSETKEQIFERFLSQFNSGDQEGMWLTVSGYQNRSGNIVVEQLIENYLEALTNDKKVDADRAMQHLVSVADLQMRKSGDAFFLT